MKSHERQTSNLFSLERRVRFGFVLAAIGLVLIGTLSSTVQRELPAKPSRRFLSQGRLGSCPAWRNDRSALATWR
jgi:hypothetical protein